MTRVLLADSSSLIRGGCIYLLGLELVDSEFLEAANLTEVTAALRQNAPDMLFIDPQLPGCNGAADFLTLRSQYLALRIVVLGTTFDRATIMSYVMAGVNGYVLKTMSIDQTLNAVRTVLGGGVYIPLEMTHLAPDGEASLASFSSPVDLGTVRFTARQADVLRLLAEGRSTKHMARTLNLAVGTIKVHLAAVYRILGAHDRLEAVIRAGAIKL